MNRTLRFSLVPLAVVAAFFLIPWKVHAAWLVPEISEGGETTFVLGGDFTEVLDISGEDRYPTNAEIDGFLIGTHSSIVFRIPFYAAEYHGFQWRLWYRSGETVVMGACDNAVDCAQAVADTCYIVYEQDASSVTFSKGTGTCQGRCNGPGTLRPAVVINCVEVPPAPEPPPAPDFCQEHPEQCT